MTRLRLGLLTAAFSLPLWHSCAAPGGKAAPMPPVIRSQPASQAAVLCGDARFEVLVAGDLPLAYHIAVDDLYVYWNDMAAHTVNRMPLAGGAATVLAGEQGYLAGIAADGEFVYWASTDEAARPPTGSIFRIHRDGGTPTRLASEPVYTLNLAVDSLMVYWTAANLRSSYAGSGSVSK